MRNKHYVVAYDVTDNKRRKRLSKWLLNFAYRVQGSVFEMSCDERTLTIVLDGIHGCLNKDEDSALIYGLDADDWEKSIAIGIRKGERNIYEENFAILD